jgi:D-methionine transport system permease protein
MSLEWILIIARAAGETLWMVFLSGFLASLLGFPLGISLFLTRPGSLAPHRMIHLCCDLFVNAWRSIPFIILLVLIIPFTRLLVGTSIGTGAAIVPLVMAAIPFFARLTDNALQDIPFGLIEAGRAMGASPLQIIRHCMLPEIVPHLIHAVTLTLVTLVGYSAMAGAVGGGGLGDLAIQYGYQRFDIGILSVTVVLLIGFVQILQSIGTFFANRFSHE